LVGEPERFPVLGYFFRCLPAGFTLSPADGHTVFFGAQSLLENARDNGGDTATVPVVTQDTSESLKPKWVTYPREKKICAVLVDDYAGDFASKFPHSTRQPAGSFSTVEWQIGDACSMHLLSLFLV
jgi:hypothetical protein